MNTIKNFFSSKIYYFFDEKSNLVATRLNWVKNIFRNAFRRFKETHSETLRNNANFIVVNKKFPDTTEKMSQLVKTLTVASKPPLTDARQTFFSSPDFIIAALKLNVSILNHAYPCFRENQEFLLKVLEIKDLKIDKINDFMHPELKQNKNFLIETLKRKGPEALHLVNQELWKDQSFIFDVLATNKIGKEEILPFIPVQSWQNDNFVLKAWEIGLLSKEILEKHGPGGLLRDPIFTNKLLRNDRIRFAQVIDFLEVGPNQPSFILEAIRIKGDKVLPDVPQAVWKDKNFISTAFKTGQHLSSEFKNHIHPEIKKDEDFFVEALSGRQLYTVIDLADDTLRKKPSFMLKMIARYGDEALRFVPTELWENQDFVLSIIENNSNRRNLDISLLSPYISETLKKDKTFGLRLLIVLPKAIPNEQFVCDEFFNIMHVDVMQNKDLVLKLMKTYPYQGHAILSKTPACVLEDVDFCLQVLDIKEFTLDLLRLYFPLQVWENDEVLLKTYALDPNFSPFSKDYSYNDSFFQKLIDQGSFDQLKKVKNNEQALRLIKNNANINLDCFNSEFFKDQHFMYLAFTERGIGIFEFISDEFKKTKNFFNLYLDKEAQEFYKDESDLTTILQLIPFNFLEDESFMLNLLQMIDLSNLLPYIPKKLLESSEFVKRVINNSKTDPFEILKSAVELTKDSKFLLSIWPKKIEILELAHSDLKKNPQFILDCFIRLELNSVTEILAFAHDDLKKDQDFIIKAFKRFYLNNNKIDAIASWADRDLMNNREFLLKAAHDTWGLVLKYTTDPKVYKDQGFLLQMYDFNNAGETLTTYIHPELRNNNAFLLQAIKIVGRGIFRKPYWKGNEKRLLDLMNDVDFMKKAKKLAEGLDQYQREILSDQGLIALASIQDNPENYKSLAKFTKSQKSIQLCALKADASLFTDEGFNNVRENEAFLREAIETNEDVLAYINEETKQKFHLGIS